MRVSGIANIPLCAVSSWWSLWDQASPAYCTQSQENNVAMRCERTCLPACGSIPADAGSAEYAMHSVTMAAFTDNVADQQELTEVAMHECHCLNCQSLMIECAG